MGTTRGVRVPVLLVAALAAAAQLATAQATAGGVLTGRSGKPLAKARVMLAEVVGDQDIIYARLRLGAKPPSAVTDAAGKFQFTGFTPGRYTILYLPAGSTLAAPPPEINIRGLSAGIKSFLPMMRGVEVGRTGSPYAERVWSRDFTLLKGHTLYCVPIGEPLMKVWNATVRRGPQGPYLEVRDGTLWMQRFDDKTQVKLEAWGL